MPLNVQVNYGRLLSWSPDGKSVLLCTRDEENAGVYKVDVQSGEKTLLVKSQKGKEYWGTPVWLPNSNNLFLCSSIDFSNSGDSKFTIFDLDTKNEKDFSPDENTEVVISPDGQWLAYSLAYSLQKDNKNIVKVFPLGENNKTKPRSYSIDENAMMIAWAPDSQSLLYGLRSSSSWSLESQDFILKRIYLKDGSIQQIWNLPISAGFGMSVNPDGKTIAFSSLVFTSELWVMENFLPKE